MHKFPLVTPSPTLCADGYAVAMDHEGEGPGGPVTSREQDAVRLLLLIDGACEPLSEVEFDRYPEMNTASSPHGLPELPRGPAFMPAASRDHPIETPLGGMA